MANTVPTSGSSDALIRLRLDTSAASADLKRFRTEAEREAVAIGRVTGGGGARPPGVSPAPGVGGGFGGGFLGGILGGGVAMAVMGALKAPLIGDLASATLGPLGGMARVASESMGLARLAREAGIPEAAAQATIQQLGIGGKFATPEQVRGLYRLNESMLGLEAGAETSIRAAIGSEQRQEYMALMRKALEMFIANWPTVVAALVGGAIGKSMGGPWGLLLGAGAAATAASAVK